SRLKITDQKKAGQALTADDVRQLVKDGVLVILPLKRPSRAAARWKHSRVRSGRRRGRGSKKGTGLSAKRKWIEKIRSQRKLLLRYKAKLKPGAFRKLYRMVKGNAFRNKHALVAYMNENHLVVS
ncbi:50S ribosomal protein L19e, partial [Candidatus Micrarchaeota archaeon]|nr:50S ribosomal protein L19e [Candidatus Micrarchaeota archaeon]